MNLMPKENFEKNRAGITYWDEKRKKCSLYFYHQFQKLNWNFITPIQAVSKHLKPQIILRKLFIIQIFSTYFNGALLLLVPLLGFLLFFIDQKTAF